jgi:hypothetical protein
MKLCLITPTAHVDMTPLLPGRFCIASEAIKYGKYFEFFKDSAARGEEVILDNGVFENELLTDEQLLELANVMRPPVLIVPDVINSRASENWERAQKFLGKMDSKCQTWKPETMFVLQTERKQESAFWTYFEKWLNDPTMFWIGICRDACRNAFEQHTFTRDQELNRFYFLAEVQRRGYLPQLQQSDKEIHLLGCGNNIWMLQYAWFVSSCDTASLFWQGASYDNTLNNVTARFPDLKRPYNYFDIDYNSSIYNESSKWIRSVQQNCRVAQAIAYKADELRKEQNYNERI